MPLAVKSILDGRGYIGKADFTTSATLQVGPMVPSSSITWLGWAVGGNFSIGIPSNLQPNLTSISWQPEGLDRGRLKLFK